MQHLLAMTAIAIEGVSWRGVSCGCSPLPLVLWTPMYRRYMTDGYDSCVSRSQTKKKKKQISQSGEKLQLGVRLSHFA